MIGATHSRWVVSLCVWQRNALCLEKTSNLPWNIRKAEEYKCQREGGIGREENEKTRHSQGPVTHVELRVPGEMMHLSLFRDKICHENLILSMTQNWKLWWQSQHLSLAITRLGEKNPETQRWDSAQQCGWGNPLSRLGGEQPQPLHLPDPRFYLLHNSISFLLRLCTSIFGFASYFLREGRSVGKVKCSLQAPKWQVHQLESKWPPNLTVKFIYSANMDQAPQGPLLEIPVQIEEAKGTWGPEPVACTAVCDHLPLCLQGTSAWWRRPIIAKSTDNRISSSVGGHKEIRVRPSELHGWIIFWKTAQFCFLLPWYLLTFSSVSIFG